MRRAGIFFFALVLITAVVGCSGGTAGTADTDPHEHLENLESMGYALTISSTAGGSIIIPGEGDFAYDGGSVVDLVAEAEPGYRFVNLTGDVDTIVDPDSASTTITINDDYFITANFEPLPSVEYSLTIDSTQGGEVTTPGEGTFTCDAGKVVDLLAVADEHYEFTGWTGDVDYVDDIYAAETTVTVWDDYSITANFELVQYTLTIDSLACGEVTSPGMGTSRYRHGHIVRLVVVAEEHYRFVGWTGDIEQIADPASPDTTITMWGDYSITVVFELVEYSLIVDSTEGGSVTVPGEGESAYPPGTVVDLVAVADEHYQFVEWTGDVDYVDDIYAAETSITVWGDYSVSAEFEKVPALEVYSVEPNSGQPKDRLIVTIFGANFQDRPSVDFGELIVVQKVTFVSASQLEVRIMVHNLAEPGPRDVTVTNPDGQSATLPDGFTVL
jgi:outer membrane lipoprotein-sorting protein